MRRYILLACTWILVSASTIYLWIRHGLEPPIGLWIILAIIAVVPLAERLKVGNWFEFTKKVENLGKEVSSTRNEMSKISSRLETFITSYQGQQQFNISLLGEETARAFAESMPFTPKMEHPTMRTDEIGLGTGDISLSEMSDTDIRRFAFISFSDEVIASVSPLLRILYSVLIEHRKHRRAESKEVLDTDILSVIEEIKKHGSEVFKFKGGDRKVKKLMEPVETLIMLRRNVDENEAALPSEKDSRKLFRAVGYTTGFFTGMFSVAVSSLFRGSYSSDSE